MSVDEERAQINVGRPHVVILGAGASRAATPEGDAGGRPLPVMADLVDLLDLRPMIESGGLPTAGGDFESLYSRIAASAEHAVLQSALQERITDYFSQLSLPDGPTVYDYLLLGLREKDVVATFNWDPFLIQAVRRNPCLEGRLPALLFLHGNVSTGFCDRDGIHGLNGALCPRCGEFYRPTPLLFPVEQKGYADDPAIASEWAELQRALKAAFWVTIYGYSAPKTDVEARALMQEAWGDWREREFEQIEIIDIRNETDLLDTWSEFVHTHHYDLERDFADSWIANHPRRTGEAYWNQYIMAKFIEPNPFPPELDLDGLSEWLGPYFSAEDQSAADV